MEEGMVPAQTTHSSCTNSEGFNGIVRVEALCKSAAAGGRGSSVRGSSGNLTREIEMNGTTSVSREEGTTGRGVCFIGEGVKQRT